MGNGACLKQTRAGPRGVTRTAVAVAAPKGDGHPCRALSVDFLTTTFCEVLGVKRSETVYDIEPRIRAAGEGVTCPRTGKPGAAYVDVAEDQHAGMATCMLSYTWGCKVCTMVDALATYCKRSGLGLADVRVWICVLCINQFRVKEAIARGEKVPFEEFQQTFRDKVTKIGKVLALITPWDKPLYMERVWTIFECYTACNHDGVTFEFVLPDSDERAFSAELRAGDSGDSGIQALSGIFTTLAQLKVQDAQARYPEDRRNVMRVLVGDTPWLDALVENRLEGDDVHAVEEACKTINRYVVHKLQETFVRSALSVLHAEMESCLRGYAHLGLLCNQLGMYTNGLEAVDAGIPLGREFCRGVSSAAAISQPGALVLTGLLRTKAKLLTYRGMTHQKDGNQHAFADDYRAAYELYTNSKQILEENGLNITTAYAELAQELSIWHGKMQQIDEAIEMGRLAKTTFENIQKTQSTMYANLLKSLGISFFNRSRTSRQGRLARGAAAGASTAGKEQDQDSAAELFEQSQSIFRDIGEIKNPWYLDLQTWIGALYAESGKPTEAREKFLFAKRELEALGLEASPQYVEVVKRLEGLG